MVAVYGYSDKVMIKYYLSEVEVGYYSCAVALCSMWTFILTAIIDSMQPEIINSKKRLDGSYEQKLTILYACVFYLSVFVSCIFFSGGEWIISILYGEQFIPAYSCLQLITWYTAFSYMGVARNIWLVCEGYQKYMKYIYFVAAIINVFLNMILIPAWGTAGAAVASLITQIGTCMFIPHILFKPMRQNSHLIINAICLKNVNIRSLVLKNK